MSSPVDNITGGSGPTGKSKLLQVVEQLGLGIDKQIGKRLTNIEKQIDSITRKAKNFSNGGSNFGGGEIGMGGVSTPAEGGGGGFKIGLGKIRGVPGTDVVPYDANFAASQMQQGGGGSGLGMGLLKGLGMVALGAGAAAYGAMPNVMDAVGQNLTAQSVASMNGMSVRRIIRGSNNMLAGGMTSNYSAQEAAAAVLYGGGYLYGGTSAGNILRSTGGFSILTGLSNARVAAAAAGVNGMTMLRLGISPRDSQGNLRAPDQLAAQLYRRTYGSRQISAETAAAVFNPGSVAYANTMAAAGGNQDLFQMLANYQVQMARNGGQPISMKPGDVFNQMGIGEDSPYRKNFKYQGSEANALESTSESLVAGYGAALDTVTKLNNKFAELASDDGVIGDVIQGLAKLSGALNTFPSLGNMGSTLTGLVGQGISSLGNVASSYLGYKGVQKGIDAWKASKGIDVANKTAQTANTASKAAQTASTASKGLNLGSVASKVLPILGKAAPVLGKVLPGIGAAYTLYDTHTAGRANRAEGTGFDWGNLFESVVSGAVSGGFTGGPWGAVAGAILNPINYSIGYAMGAGGGDDSGASAANAHYGTEGLGAGDSQYRTPQQAAQWALNQARRGTSGWKGLCERFARSSYGLPAKYPSAAAHWRDAVKTGRAHRGSTPPVGALVYWTGGSKGYGHAAVSIGGGKVVSTDIKRKGKADVVTISELNQKWGNLHYEGWADPPHTKITGAGEPIRAEVSSVNAARPATSGSASATNDFGYSSSSESSSSSTSSTAGGQVMGIPANLSASMSGFTSSAALTVTEMLGAEGQGGPGELSGSGSTGNKYHVTMNVQIARASNQEAARLAKMVKNFIENDSELDRIGKF